jgi:hypothetical protein
MAKPERRRLRVGWEGVNYLLQQLFPADFLDETTWPFFFYHVRGEKIEKDNATVWKLKEKKIIEQEEKSKSLQWSLLEKGIVEPKLSDAELEKIFENETTRNFLVGCLFLAAYYSEIDVKFSDAGIAFNDEPREISREQLEKIYLDSKARNGCEPWAIMFGPEGPAEGFNPRRHNFNQLVFRVGWEMELAAIEDAKRKAANGR